MLGMKIAVTGSRDGTIGPDAWQGFWELFERLGGTELHHGDCRGVDREIARFVAAHGVPVVAHPANWELYGKAAGPIRNQQMALEAGAVLAFPGGAGTEDCIRAFRSQGKTVHRLTGA